MSERNGLFAVLTTFLFMLLIAFIWGDMQRDAGHAEQKKWDAEWYAAHPVVKEVPLFNGKSDDYWKGYKAAMDDAAKALNPPKPQKGSKRAPRELNEYLLDAPTQPEKEPAPSAHEVVSPLIRMLDTRSKDGLSKFYVTIPPVEGHWEVWATDRINALLRLGSTSWTEQEWKDCEPCANNRNIGMPAPQTAEKPE